MKLVKDVIQRFRKQLWITRGIELSAGFMAVIVDKIEDLAIAEHLLGVVGIAIVAHAEDDAGGFQYIFNDAVCFIRKGARVVAVYIEEDGQALRRGVMHVIQNHSYRPLHGQLTRPVFSLDRRFAD